MKLISLNVALKIDNAKRIGKFIKSHNPDIVTYQEIMRPFEKSVFSMYQSEPVIESIAKFPYKFFGPKWITDKYTKNGKMHRDLGGMVEQGNEIMSKFSIISATNEHFYKKYSYEYDWTNWRQIDEPRSVIIVELDINGKSLQVLNLHGIWSEDKKGNENAVKQCKYVLNAAKRKNIPTIIVGDFNLLPETKGIKMISKEFRNLIEEFNIKSTRPGFMDGTDKGGVVVDYIFVNNKIKVNRFEVIQTDISDHLPLILDFEIL